MNEIAPARWLDAAAGTARDAPGPLAALRNAKLRFGIGVLGDGASGQYRLLMLKLAWLGVLLSGVACLASESTNTAAQAVNALGVKLLPRLGNEAGNTLISPYSIQLALAMTYSGAKGETRDQMAKALDFPKDPAELNAAFAALQKQLAEMTLRSGEAVGRAKKTGGPSEPITLTVANRLFGQSGYAFRPEYLALLRDNYAAALDQVDFVKNPSSASKRINGWVAKETRDRIRNLVPPGAITKDTTLVVVDAIHLKAPWAVEFNKESTTPQPFHVAGGTTVNVPTMQQQASFGYSKQNGMTALSVPYSGDELQLLILMPDNAGGAGALQKKLNAAELARCANLESRDVILYLPKFKIEPPVFVLGRELQALGMKSAFDVPRSSANFDGIAPRGPDDYLYISDVFHKTFVDVDEKGTEAAAATAVVMWRAASVMPQKEGPLEVRIDRPFLFAIQHRPSGACLFLGRVNDPQ